MPISRQALAAVLAEKAKQNGLPSINNPLAKTANMGMVNPMNVPSPMPAMTPAFKPPGKFTNLKNKLRQF